MCNELRVDVERSFVVVFHACMYAKSNEQLWKEVMDLSGMLSRRFLGSLRTVENGSVKAVAESLNR